MKYSDQEKQMEDLLAQIEELKRLNQKSQNQGIKKEVDSNKAKEELTRLNALLNDKDEEIAKVQRKLKSQESKICRHQQQMKELQQKYDDIRRVDNLEIIKNNNTLTSKTKES